VIEQREKSHPSSSTPTWRLAVELDMDRWRCPAIKLMRRSQPRQSRDDRSQGNPAPPHPDILP